MKAKYFSLKEVFDESIDDLVYFEIGCFFISEERGELKLRDAGKL